MTVDDAKLYLRVETDDHTDDGLIESLVSAATKYVEKSTGKTYVPEDELWNLVIKMLVTHWYDNRGTEVTGTITSKISHTVDTLVGHLSMCGDYS